MLAGNSCSAEGIMNGWSGEPRRGGGSVVLGRGEDAPAREKGEHQGNKSSQEFQPLGLQQGFASQWAAFSRS